MVPLHLQEANASLSSIISPTALLQDQDQDQERDHYGEKERKGSKIKTTLWSNVKSNLSNLEDTLPRSFYTQKKKRKVKILQT